MATTSATTPLTIKVRRGDELRRFTVDVPIEFAALSATVRSLFSLPPNAPMVLKYQDNEGDLITVSSDVELVEAIRVHAGNAGNILRLDLLVPKVAVAAATATAKPPVASSAAKSPVAKAAPAANPPIDALPVVSLRPGGGVPPPVAATSAPAPTLLLAPQGKNEVSAPTAIVKPADKQQQRMAERELQRAQLVAAKAEQKRLAQQRLLEKKEAMLQKKQQAASEKAEKEQTEASAAHYQHLKAELDRIKMELLAYREAKRAGALDAPTGKALMWARFVRDVTVPDGSVLQANEAFTKTWRFRNELDQPWPQGTRLLFVGKNSDRLGAPDEVAVTQLLQPKEETDISVPLVAPAAPGRYTAYFRLAAADGKKFGQRVWVTIAVGSGSSSDEEAAAPPSAEALAAFHVQLNVLAQLRFVNNALNLRLLRKFNGNLEEVVAVLIKRRAQENKKSRCMAAPAPAPVAAATPPSVASTTTPGGPPTTTPVAVPPPIASSAVAGPVPIPVPSAALAKDNAPSNRVDA